MDKGKLKTFFLAGLILFSVFQTGELWFGSLSSHNFFYNLWAKSDYTNIVYSGEPVHLLQPTEIIINFGVEGGKYNILKNTKEEFKIAQKEMADILGKTFSSGEFISQQELSWRDILSQRSILYKYPGTIPMKELVDSQNKIAAKIPGFDQILVVPGRTINQKINCFFIDESSDYVYVVAVKHDVLVLHEVIDNLRDDIAKISYISTKQVNMNQFENNVFLPTFNTHPVYQKIEIKDEIKENGEVNEEKLERLINPLFINPTLKRKQQTQDGTIYYIEGNTMVKYFTTGVIEYLDQSRTKKDDSLSFIEAYQVAKSFLDKHKMGLNQDDLKGDLLYLSGQKQTNSGWEFCFDFKFKDIPYDFSREITNKTGMKHAVEIVIQDKKIKEYKRVTWIGYLLDEEAEVNLTYPEALGEVVKRLNDEEANNIKIKDMYWAYYQKEIDKPAEVYWMIKAGNKIYPIKASR